MKRSVAIYGPTPQFVRWAISHDCPFRDIDVDNLPDRTFRQLRGLRELSQAKIDNRVFEGYCLHPDALSDAPEKARGFHRDEVLVAFGDPEFISQTCRQCPANAFSDTRPQVWAGCYGVLAATSGFNFETLLTSSVNFDNLEGHPVYRPGRFDFVDLIDQAVGELGVEAAGGLFPCTSPHWYGIWRNGKFEEAQLHFLAEVLDVVIAHCRTLEAIASEINEVVQLKRAVECCIKFRLELVVELVPPGDSDGVAWVINSHCPECKMSMAEGLDRCQACGRVGRPHGIRKSKVLGLRPYVTLEGVLGGAKTVELLSRYEAMKKESEPNDHPD